MSMQAIDRDGEVAARTERAAQALFEAYADPRMRWEDLGSAAQESWRSAERWVIASVGRPLPPISTQTVAEAEEEAALYRLVAYEGLSLDEARARWAQELARRSAATPKEA
jgi:hypothetical protein